MDALIPAVAEMREELSRPAEAGQVKHDPQNEEDPEEEDPQRKNQAKEEVRPGCSEGLKKNLAVRRKGFVLRKGSSELSVDLVFDDEG